MKEFGILSLPTGLGSNTPSYEAGWEFTVGSKPIRVIGLRVYTVSPHSKTLKLWNSLGALLASVAVTSVQDQWVEGLFATPILLEANTTYTVSGNFIGYYYTPPAGVSFNSKVSYVRSRTGSSGTYPTGNLTTANLYGFPDIMIDDLSFEISGDWISQPIDLSAIDSTASTSLAWTETAPAGTSVRVACAITGDGLTPPADELYLDAVSGGPIPGIAVEDNLAGKFLWVKVWLATTDDILTPEIEGLALNVLDTPDAAKMQLNFDANNRFNNAVGAVSVSYDGAGTLQGSGGFVEPFAQQFAATGLRTTSAGEVEHVTARVTDLALDLKRVCYTDAYHQEHVTARVTGLTMVLTRVSYNNP